MKDWKYILYVFGAVAVFVIVKLLAPKQYDWTITYAHGDKNPYGTYALNQLLPDVFEDRKVSHDYKTLYELKDSIGKHDNLFILTSTFTGGKEDTEVLLKHVGEGGSAFISAQYYWGTFKDTLKINLYDYFFTHGDTWNKKDTAYLKMVNTSSDTTQRFWYQRDNVHNFFQKFDTTRTTVLARNDYGQPVTIRMKWGKGNIILNSTPLAFTNIYLLSKNNPEFVSQTLSALPSENLRWTEYYHLGRRESESPLRFILTNESLRWGYYITIASLLLFMVFEAKRKQRIIPVVKPLSNTSLEFVSTIGNLYYQNGDHKNMAEKRIAFLLEQIRSKYLLKTNLLNEAFYYSLSGKSGKSFEQVQALFKTIKYIQSSTLISATQLMELNDKIEQFESPN